MSADSPRTTEPKLLDQVFDALTTLPEDALGYGEDDNSRWPLRDELMAAVDKERKRALSTPTLADVEAGKLLAEKIAKWENDPDLEGGWDNHLSSDDVALILASLRRASGASVSGSEGAVPSTLAADPLTTPSASRRGGLPPNSNHPGQHPTDASGFAERGLAQDGWQPIETAPRDGTRFLVLMNNGEMHVAKALRNASTFIIGGAFGFDRSEKPTHWRPLPAPPQENGK